MRLLSKSLLAAAIAAIPGSALATVFTTDISLVGYVANGGFTDPTNTRTHNLLAPNAFITGVEWLNLEYDSTNGSFRSELVLSTNTSTESAFWDHRPAITETSPGHHGPSSGVFPNPGNAGGGPFQLLADGDLLVYIYDTFNDPNPEETITAGTLRVTWDDTPPPPPPPPAGAVDVFSGGSLSGTLLPGEVDWYHFTWGGGLITLDTEGSLLVPSNDTEIGLYGVNGALIASDDDTGTGNLSLLSGTLAAGEYYLAVGGFNTTFGATGYGVTSTSTNIGPYNVNGLSIPEPGSLGVLLAGGLCVTARRRRHA